MSLRSIVSCLLALLCTKTATAQDIRDGADMATTGSGVFVTAQQAETLRIQGAVLLDTRGPADFLAGHAPGAVRVDWRDYSTPEQLGLLDSDADRLQQRIEALGVERERAVVVMGDWHLGWGEEGRIFWMLEVLGHSNVGIVEGGFRAWTAAGLQVSRAQSVPQTGAFPLAPRTGPLVSLEQLHDPSIAILDVRTRDEFEGATPHGSVRGGHLPGAQHLDWQAFFDDDGRLLPEEELERLLPEPEQRVVAYCTGGVRSGFAYAVMRALGRDNVGNYAGSWWEYAASGLPVE